MSKDTSTAAIAALLKRVTAGPWTVPDAYISEVERADGRSVLSCWHEDAVGQTINLHDVADCTIGESAANARFIASARDLVPALVAERDALVTERDALRTALGASIAFADGVAGELGIDMSETVFAVRVMPSGREVSARSWASVQEQGRQAVAGQWQDPAMGGE